MDAGTANAVPPVSPPQPADTFEPGDKQPFHLLGAESQGHCLVCGYSLVGLAEHAGQARCPECGHEMDASAFVVRGMAGMRSTMPPLRVAAWVLVIVPPVIVMQTWTLILMLRSVALLIVLLTGFAAWCVVLGWLVATGGKRGSKIAADFFFTSTHFGTYYSASPTSCFSHRWEEATGFRLKTLSPNWHQLRIFGGSRTLLNLGFRCSVANARVVDRLLKRQRAASRPEAEGGEARGKGRGAVGLHGPYS